MPWSVWIVALAMIVQLSEYGSFFFLILWSPVMMINIVWQSHPGPTLFIANAIGVKPVYIWPTTIVLGAGLVFAVLAQRKPESSFYKNAAILLLGLLAAAAISVHRLSGFGGI